MIDSVLEQDVDFELLFMDGGSTDNTHEIINSYQDTRIKLFIIPTDNSVGELQKRVNMGIEKVNGDVFFLTSGHDWFFEGALKAIEENINDTGWVMGRLAKVSEDGRILKRIEDVRYSCGFIKMDLIRKHNIRLNPNLVAADYDLFMQVRGVAGEPKRIDNYIFKYMQHSSALNKKFKVRIRRERKDLDMQYADIKEVSQS